MPAIVDDVAAEILDLKKQIGHHHPPCAAATPQPATEKLSFGYRWKVIES